MATRSKNHIWLVGYEEATLTGSKLPSVGQVLKVFFYHHRHLKKTVRDSARDVIKETVEFWRKSRIPTMEERNATEVLMRLHTRWINLKKDENKQSEVFITRREQFVSELNTLFDIAHVNVMSLLTNVEDIEFLKAQRESGRRGIIAGVDMNLAVREKKSAQKQESLIQRKRKTTVEKLILNERVHLESSSDSAGDSANETEFQILDAKKKFKSDVVTPELCAALDRAGTSDRKATLVVTATAKSFGQDVNECNIAVSTFRRARIRHRSVMATQLKKKFTVNKPIVVHWDGKMMEDITGKKVDRLPIVVSGGGVDQLLGVPKLAAGTGSLEAHAVVDSLDQWGLREKVMGLCFDTTSVNTGRKSGACILIEQLLGKDLLYLACRHHVPELVLEAAFEKDIETSSGPDVKIFQRFKAAWNTIDTGKYDTVAGDEILSPLLDDIDGIIQFCKNQLESHLPRDDFVSQATNTFFTCLAVDTSFLDMDPDTWASHEGYKEAYETAKGVRVVNDNAERGVKLMSEYNHLITKDEDQKQFLLQVVADHRKKHPCITKATLCK